VSANTIDEVDFGHDHWDRARIPAPALLLISASQFLLLLVAAEALYPGYSVATNAISDLGVGETAIIFNSSIILFGSTSFAAAYLLRRRLGRLLPVCMALAGIGAICVGLFPETLGLPHYLSALTAFLFEG
jgi:Predicted membrane protein